MESQLPAHRLVGAGEVFQTSILGRLHPTVLWPLRIVSRSFRNTVQRVCVFRFREACLRTKRCADLQNMFYFLFRLHGHGFVGRLLEELKPDFTTLLDIFGTNPLLTWLEIAAIFARSSYGDMPHAVKFLRRAVCCDSDLDEFDKVMGEQKGTQVEPWIATEDMLPTIPDAESWPPPDFPSFPVKESLQSYQTARMRLLHFDGRAAIALCLDSTANTNERTRGAAVCFAAFLTHGGVAKEVLLLAIANYTVRLLEAPGAPKAMPDYLVQMYHRNVLNERELCWIFDWTLQPGPILLPHIHPTARGIWDHCDGRRYYSTARAIRATTFHVERGAKKLPWPILYINSTLFGYFTPPS
ncbi:hypothetical protein M427DRAFT_54258 [Gonapodya prolifera JEL478]|uniref:F-box domain-containing protein n=1 Tax=Gonapodya prolifera (strain JEL478) TaxID=1344416 RepID=A0A139AMQ0_GONPJ|nr:hypothetical protein M427DRAFT_54258 [Gonapodya prolifera JEL478]|eukprot:KXS18050.1 hypothetical protein M427DRAFT_54258 [Gonapodya prolifera JEL478]